MALSSELATATAEIGAGMTVCEVCPGCGGSDLQPVPCRNDLHAMDDVSDSMKDSDYHACPACGLIFARRRQTPAQAALFYRWFAHLEHRDYAVYPPPAPVVTGKAAFAAEQLRYLADQGVLSPGMTIAHLRCDVGSLMAQLRDRMPDCSIHGYDYFESNVRFAADQGIDGVELLDPAGVTLPDGAAYDLIICNHVFTHALDPIADLRKLFAAVKPGGLLYLYNEVDHFLRFQPNGAYFQWVALNNFHKQLFAPASLKYFLGKGGFSVETLDHRKFYMQLLAKRAASGDRTGPDDQTVQAARAAAPVMARNFQRWAALRESRFLGLIKIASKLRNSLGPPKAA